MTTKHCTVRLLLNNKEAGIVIGKNGATIDSLRNEFNVRAGISSHMDHCADRVCTLQGPLDDVCLACDYIASELPKKTIRLLLSHFLVGPLIGKKGANIKKLRESGVKVICQEDILPQSTDRLVIISGEIPFALQQILDNTGDQQVNQIYYTPGKNGHEGVLGLSIKQLFVPNEFKESILGEEGVLPVSTLSFHTTEKARGVQVSLRGPSRKLNEVMKQVQDMIE